MIRGRVLQSNIAEPRPRAAAASGQKSSGGQRWNGWGKCRPNEFPSGLNAALGQPAFGKRSRVPLR
jgi:hypothetical protein